MKIGKHLGQRAKFNNHLGYFFQTINQNEHNLFVYDGKYGHNASPYFDYHPNEWNDELKTRCWFIRPEYITLEKPKIIL